MHMFLPPLPRVLGRFAPCGLLLALGLGSCTSDLARTTLPPTAQPLVGVRDAFESASEVQLPTQEPINGCGLRNAFRLSENIYSGSEPNSAEAFGRLEAWGVKTVISVDGKAPDVEAADAHTEEAAAHAAVADAPQGRHQRSDPRGRQQGQTVRGGDESQEPKVRERGAGPLAPETAEGRRRPGRELGAPWLQRTDYLGRCDELGARRLGAFPC